MIAGIITETGWTYRELLWEHTGDQVRNFVYNNSRINQKMIEKIKDPKGEKKGVVLKKPQTKADYEALDRAMNKLQSRGYAEKV